MEPWQLTPGLKAQLQQFSRTTAGPKNWGAYTPEPSIAMGKNMSIGLELRPHPDAGDLLGAQHSVHIPDSALVPQLTLRVRWGFGDQYGR
jgi:hypothetical protein